MSIRTVTGYTAVCDVCEDAAVTEYSSTWETQEDAACAARDEGWAVSWDDATAVCTALDDGHRQRYQEVMAGHRLEALAARLEHDHGKKRRMQKARGLDVSPEMDHETALKIAAWHLEQDSCTEGCDQ